MFDLDLIERALGLAVTAQPNYRRGKATTERAYAEFAKLRKAIEGAPRVTATRNGVVRTAVSACKPNEDYLLVKADEP